MPFGFGPPAKSFTTDPIEIARRYAKRAKRKQREHEDFLYWLIFAYLLLTLKNDPSQIRDTLPVKLQSILPDTKSPVIAHRQSENPVFREKWKDLPGVHRSATAILKEIEGIPNDYFVNDYLSNKGVEKLLVPAEKSLVKENGDEQLLGRASEAAIASKMLILAYQIDKLFDKYDIDEQMPFAQRHITLGILASQDDFDFHKVQNFHMNLSMLSNSKLGKRIKHSAIFGHPEISDVIAHEFNEESFLDELTPDFDVFGLLSAFSSNDIFDFTDQENEELLDLEANNSLYDELTPSLKPNRKSYKPKLTV